MSVARPATAGCPQKQLVGGDGVQAGVRRPHPGGSGRPAGLRACPARHGRGPRGAHEAIEDWVRGPTSGSGAETYFPPSIGRRTIVGGGVGQWVSVSGSRVSALAAGGSARRRVVPSRRANRSARLAAIEPASRIQRTHPVSEPNSIPCPFTRPYRLRSPTSHLLLCYLLSLMCPITYPHMPPPLVLSSP